MAWARFRATTRRWTPRWICRTGVWDAVVIDTLPARQFVLSLDGLIMRDDILKDAPVESYGIAVPMGQEELVEKINDSLERMMEDGTFDAILVKYVESEEAEESRRCDHRSRYRRYGSSAH